MQRLAQSDSLAWLQHVVEHTRDYAIVITDARGAVIDWLGAAETVLGYTADEAIGQPLAIIFTPEDRAAGAHFNEMETARRTGRSEDDRWHLRKSGVRFWSSGILQPVRAVDGTLVGYCKILRDRTDVRTQIESLQHRTDALAGELQRRSEFMVRLGHELRNPLAAIRAAGYTIQRIGDPAVQRPCEVLERQVSVLVRLLDDLAEATRADARIARVIPQPVVLHDAVQLAVAAVQQAVDAKKQQLSVIVPDVPIVFEADPARLQQMLTNLLTNASKFTPLGGHVSISATTDASAVVIHVEDNGVGIPPDVLPHIFELFTRSSTTASMADGLGVGLAVVKELATLHGGGIEARSGAQGGSVFTLRLPLQQRRE
ncbi:PAS domain-containing sensor histidine kinase [Piscinibacter sp. XHJ-5]|uniref:PAS domain-containing sensor histidine kinase n=1 Tax=Piscinibacter sp. XHJ-5 TaxID=3037797 RepID=UPI00245302D2|nr:PAS domain-containing sensor histidine kinase [Piscinibacter sp. XHJ-5]